MVTHRLLDPGLIQHGINTSTIKTVAVDIGELKSYILIPSSTYQWAKIITCCMFIWKKLPFWPPKSFMEHLVSSRDHISIHTGLISNMNHKQCKTPWTWSELFVRSLCSWPCPKFLWDACACSYRLWGITGYTSSFCTVLIAVKCSFISFPYEYLHEVITFSECFFFFLEIKVSLCWIVGGKKVQPEIKCIGFLLFVWLGDKSHAWVHGLCFI